MTAARKRIGGFVICLLAWHAGCGSTRDVPLVGGGARDAAPAISSDGVLLRRSLRHALSAHGPRVCHERGLLLRALRGGELPGGAAVIRLSRYGAYMTDAGIDVPNHSVKSTPRTPALAVVVIPRFLNARLHVDR